MLYGRFESALIGFNIPPVGFTGSGSLEARPDGLVVRGQLERRGLMHGLGCLFMIAALLIAGAIVILLGQYAPQLKADGLTKIAGIAVIPSALLGLWLGRRVAKPKPVEMVFEWRKIANAERMGQRLKFRSLFPPAGEVEFVVDQGSPEELGFIAQAIGRGY